MILEDKEFWFIGGMFLTLGLYLTIKQFIFAIKAEKAIGIITGVYHSKTDSGSSEMGFDYSYNGRVIHITTRAVSSSYRTGQNIPVLYNKNNPLDAHVHSFFGMYFMGFVFVLIGLVFIYVPFS